MIVESNFGISDYDSYLRKLYAGFLFCKTKTKDGDFYGVGFYARQLSMTKQWIVSDPINAVKRLQDKHQCIYCNARLSETFPMTEDIINGKTLPIIALPCCSPCFLSKQNWDLVEWVRKMKSKSIMSIDKDVFSIYIRRVYKNMSDMNRLSEPIKESYMKVFDDLTPLQYFLEPKTLDQWNKC